NLRLLKRILRSRAAHSSPHKERRMRFLIITLTILAAALALAQSPPSVQAWDPASIVWQQTFPDGSKFSVLEGDKHASGSFTYALFVPAGSWDDHSHFHNHDARVAVVSGALVLSV